jgi:hypothetical protein
VVCGVASALADMELLAFPFFHREQQQQQVRPHAGRAPLRGVLDASR